MHISVVERVLMQILAAQCAFVAALLFQRVNHCRIALQQHALFQAIFKDSCNQGALVRLRGFAFDQRSQRDRGDQRRSPRTYPNGWRDLATIPRETTAPFARPARLPPDGYGIDR